jgi:uncharacterized membrane protein YsdA (DUF1294 family)
MNYSFYLVIAVFIWNLFVFILYGADKKRAVNSKRRIRERTLFLVSFFMGAPGSLIGMRVFRHKTKHLNFWILNTLFLVVNIAAVHFYLTYLRSQQ